MIAWEKKYGAADDSTRGFDEGWGKPGYDASTWKSVTIPTDFRAAGLPGGGIVWFRKELMFPPRRPASRSNSIRATRSIWCKRFGTARGLKANTSTRPTIRTARALRCPANW